MAVAKHRLRAADWKDVDWREKLPMIIVLMVFGAAIFIFIVCILSSLARSAGIFCCQPLKKLARRNRALKTAESQTGTSRVHETTVTSTPPRYPREPEIELLGYPDAVHKREVVCVPTFPYYS